MSQTQQDKPQATTGPIKVFYERLFASGFLTFDPGAPFFQERLLQVMWNEQYLVDELSCEDGSELRVVHHGVWNVESGPDFHDAALYVNGELKRGAVEIHLEPEAWGRHGHDGNADYANTILHVVWENAKGHRQFPAGVPLFAVAKHLSRPLQDIIDQVDVSAYPYASKVKPGAPAAGLAAISDRNLAELFQSYGVARILQKARVLSEAIERHGLEEAVYRQFLDAMGYKSNRAPFAQLAESLPLADLATDKLAETQALLFGAAGLLPDPSQDPVLPQYQAWVREMWQLWWPRRREYRAIEWSRRRLRPYNSPERRLLAAAMVLQQNAGRLGQRLVRAFIDHDDPAACLRQIRAIWELDPAQLAEFYSFAKVLERPAALLGRSRIDDLVINLAIPLFFAHCFLHNDPDRCRKGKAVLLQAPRLQGNRLLREANHHFFVPPSRARDVIGNACAQQGLLKLYQDFHVALAPSQPAKSAAAAR